MSEVRSTKPWLRQVHLIGLPTDSHSSFLRGAAAAPAAIRAALASAHSNASAELGGEFGTDIGVHDWGDLPLVEAVDSDDAQIDAAIGAALAAGGVPISLGGDHSVTFPIVRRIAQAIGPVNILHIDAHHDLYDDFEGDPRSHASPFARIMEGGFAHGLVQVGIRTLNRHGREQADRFGVRIVPMLGYHIDAVPVLEGPLYISLDMDGFDPAVAPGVSHIEPGGLTVREVLALLDRQAAPIVGADVVELNPSRDVNGMTAILAAKMVKELAALAMRNGFAFRS
ncbi:agmatinase [Flavisphingomonas formosensis]|uniref:agmatinase n=1 Tax=Flavisphingomonas formosensis TaxID=861534 RepID=UPI001E4C0F60|nr:agmatinase [Sphingomonas formosensis]